MTMTAKVLHMPSPADRLCAGMPMEAVIAADWDGDWGPSPEVEVAQFLVPRPDAGDEDESVFVTVAVDPARMRALSALVTVEEPQWADVERLLCWLDVPGDVMTALDAEQVWPGMASPSTTLICAKRWGIGCGCKTCRAADASAFACDVAAAALAYVAMHGGPGARTNLRLMAALPQWVAFFTQPLAA